MRISDWSSDVCSSDLFGLTLGAQLDRARSLRIPPFRGDDRLAVAGLRRGAAGDSCGRGVGGRSGPVVRLRKVRSEEHTSELQSLMRISYAVFCLKKNKKE